MIARLQQFAGEHKAKRIVRDDRELVRARIDLADEMTRVKLQVLSLLKRRGIAKPSWCKGPWSKRFVAWLRKVAEDQDQAVAPVLENLIRRYELHVAERARLDQAVRRLSQTDRYRAACHELRSNRSLRRKTESPDESELQPLTNRPS